MFSSLKFRIVGMVLCLSMVLTICAALQVKSLAGVSKNELRKAFEGYARNLNAAISAQYFERYGDVQAFSINKGILAPQKSDIVEVLNNLSALYLIYDLIMVVDKNGKLIAVTDKSPTGESLNVKKLYAYNFSEEEWFQNTLKGEFTANKEKGFNGTFVEQPQVDKFIKEVYGKEVYANSFSAQVKNSSGDVIGVITNRANFKWAEGELINQFSAVKSSGINSAELYLLSPEGVILSEYSPFKNSGSLDMEHNFEVLGRENYLSQFSGVKNTVSEKKIGFLDIENNDKKISKMMGFSTFNDAKFTEQLGWVAVVSADTNEVVAEVKNQEFMFYLTQTIVTLIGAILVIMFAASLSKKFQMLSGQLKACADFIASSAKKENELSSSLSSSSTEQASAIQQTMSAMTEMNSMITSTLELAGKTSVMSEDLLKKSEAGSNVMNEMVNSMEAIKDSNEELKKMAQVINDISTKTNVINDIVFKTQLLSVNASIEAARAGQHGKGFAVVAEEVGNLALVSGKAAVEIRDMLSESQKHVSKVVEGTSRRVAEGERVSHEAMKSFSDISSGVTNIQKYSAQVNESTIQQQEGVRQISSAITQMDQSAQLNSQTASEVNHLSTQLVSYGSELQNVALTTEKIIFGQTKSDKESHLEPDNMQSSESIVEHLSAENAFAVAREEQNGFSSSAKAQSKRSFGKFKRSA